MYIAIYDICIYIWTTHLKYNEYGLPNIYIVLISLVTYFFLLLIFGTHTNYSFILCGFVNNNNLNALIYGTFCKISAGLNQTENICFTRGYLFFSKLSNIISR